MSTDPIRLRDRLPKVRPSRKGWRRGLLYTPLLLLVGAMFDPSLIPPFGPLAAPAEVVTTHFTFCGPSQKAACVIDGDDFRLGDRQVRIIGIDAPSLSRPRCPAEAELARRAADRLVTLLNQGSFDMIAHRLQRMDRKGRVLMVVNQGGVSIGWRLIDEGLARRYWGVKRSWC